MTEQTDLKMALAIVDEASRAVYTTLRELGFSPEAAKDALTVHLSDTLAAAQRDRDGLPTAYEDGDGEGGVRAP